MRVLFSLLDANVGGGQRVALRVAGELRERGHALGVVAPAPGPATDAFEDLGAALHRADIGSLRGAADVTLLAHAMRGYDALYSHTSLPGEILGDAAATITKRSHVIHQHTVARVSPTILVGAAHRMLYRATVARRPIIAVAPHVRKAVLALGARPGKVEVVPNGVDLDELGRVSEGLAMTEGVRVGMLARFDPQKGIEVFLEAASLLMQTEAAFSIGASGTAYPQHEDRVRSAARVLGVEVVDPGNDGASYLAGLDIVVLPSLGAEGAPLTLLEAMGLGKPVVASNVEGIGTMPGVAASARLVPAGDAIALGREIRSLIDDGKARELLGERALSLVRSLYDAHETARASADIVERSVTQV